MTKRNLAIQPCFLALLLTLNSALVNAAGQFHDGRGRGAEWSDLSVKLSQAIQLGDYDLAENYARKRMDLALSIGPNRRIGNAYRNLGSVLRLRGDFVQAESFIRKAQPFLDDGNGQLSHQAIRNMMVLTSILMSTSRFAEASAVSMEALTRQQAYAPHSNDMLEIYNKQGNIQRRLGRFDDAETILKKAVSTEISPDPVDNDDVHAGTYWVSKRRADTLYQFSLLELQRGKFDKAETYIRQTIDAFRAIGNEKHPDLIKSLSLLGTVLMRQGRYQEAEPLLLQALNLSEQVLGANHHQTALALFSMAEVVDKQGRAREADPLFSRAMKIIRKEGAWDQFAFHGQSYVRFLKRQHQLLPALVLQREILDVVDKLFAQTRGLDDASRESLMARFGTCYFEATSLLLELHQVNPKDGYDAEILSVASRTQSRVFSEMLRLADVSGLATNKTFSELKDNQIKLNTRLEDLQRTSALILRKDYLDDNNDENGARIKKVDDPLVQERIDSANQRVRAEISETISQRDAVDAVLWEKFPRYMELVQPRPITVETLQKKILKPGEKLLTYFLLPDITLAFVVNREDFKMIQMPVGRSEVAEMVAAARAPEESVAGKGFAGLSRLEPALLNKLYTSIFQPAEKYLAGTQRLLVIADGPLHTLPLEMLVTRFGETERKAFDSARTNQKEEFAEYKTLPYLGEQYRFAYSPSLSALTSMRLYRKPEVTYERDLVSFADPVFDKSQSASLMLNVLTRGLRHNATLEIPRLPETADEAREIANIVGGRSEIFLRDKAQEFTAKTFDWKSTKYIHFATHGLLAGEFSELSEAYATAENQSTTQAKQRSLVRVKSQLANSIDLDEAPLQTEVKKTAKAEPALLLSLSGDMRGEDGLLTMSEIVARMDLNAKLVVLSACNTAGEGSEANNGEGFAGLTRSFMYAGAHGLLVSQWSVESQATQNLMTDTFRNLGKKQDSLEAIDYARATIRNSTVQLNGHNVSRSHPYFWAPFVFVGE